MFQRIANLFKGFLGLFISGLERENPEALLDVEQENLRKQIGKFNAGLAAHAGLVERLIAQVRNLENDQADLRAKTSANLKLGNREAAGQYPSASRQWNVNWTRTASKWSRRRPPTKSWFARET